MPRLRFQHISSPHRPTPHTRLLGDLFVLSPVGVEQLLVRLSRFAALDDALALLRQVHTFALETRLCDQTLNLGGLGLLLALDLATDDVLADVLVLRKVEQLADVAGTLGSQTAGTVAVGETRNGFRAFLDKNQVEHSKVWTHNGTTHTLALLLASAALAVALHSLAEEEAHTVIYQNSLHHRESLFVIPAGNAEDVSFEFVANRISGDFRAHALLEEGQQPLLIVDFDGLLETRLGIRQVKFHLAGEGQWWGDGDKHTTKGPQDKGNSEML